MNIDHELGLYQDDPGTDTKNKHGHKHGETKGIMVLDAFDIKHESRRGQSPLWSTGVIAHEVSNTSDSDSIAACQQRIASIYD